jgi:peroxiredoxin Q/BCP
MENTQAPDFTLQDQNGNTHTLSNYLGTYVLLFFYPKDMTSGCTKEACGFRDNYALLKEKGVEIFGLSPDSVESHKKFETKELLNFTLLADVEKKVVQAYGVWVEKSMYGRKYMGVQRDSFLIGPKGKIIKHFPKVKAAKHPQEVVDYIDSI